MATLKQGTLVLGLAKFLSNGKFLPKAEPQYFQAIPQIPQRSPIRKFRSKPIIAGYSPNSPCSPLKNINAEGTTFHFFSISE